MSVNSKARGATSIEQLLIEMKMKMQVLETRIRERDGVSSLETKIKAGGGGVSGPTGSSGFLATEGDTMIGPIAYFPKLQPIDTSDGSLNVARDFGEAFSSRVIVSNLTAAPGINFIHGAAYAGQLLILQGILTETFTVFNGVGNIRTFDGADIVVTDNQNVWLIFDSIANEWAAIGAAGGGGSGLSDPIILNENDHGSLALINELVDWSTHNFHRMTVTDDISITMQNLPAAGKWEQVIIEITQDAIGGHAVTFLDTFANGVTPTINPGANSKTTVVFYAYNDGGNVILAFDVNSNFTEFPEFDHGTVGPAAINIDWGDANFQRMILAGDVTITHTNLPSPGNWQEVVVEYTQDITGGHAVTYTQGFANGVTPIVNQPATAKTTVVFYAYNTGVITILLAFETTTTRDFIHATKVANQAPPLTVGNPALFDSILSNSGITVAAGVFSGFKAGRTYECECSMAILNAVLPTACVDFQFFDVAGATLIGSRGDAILSGQNATDSSQPVAKAIFKPTANTDTLELRFGFNNDLVNTFMYGMGIAGTPQTYVMIKEIT